MKNKYFDENLYSLEKNLISEELSRNRFSLKLKFKKELEKKFENYYYFIIKESMRFTIILGVIIYFIFGILDFLTYRNLLKELFIIRYIVGGIPVVLISLLVLKAKKSSSIQTLFSITLIIVGISLILMILIVNDETNRYYAGLTVVLLFSYVAVGLRLKYSLIIGWGLILIYSVLSIFFMKVNSIFQINNIFFLIFFNIIGMISSFFYEKHQRNLFLLSSLIVIKRKELEKANKKLKELSIKDPLTKIANRRYFDDFYKREWKRALRHNQPISIIMLDIDYFKKYNDSLGHQKGDKVLHQIAKVLNNFTRRAGDLVARYGGEEFIIVLSGTNNIHAFEIANKIKQKISELKIHHPNSDISNYLTISFGISTTIPTKQKDFETLIKKADDNLYKAKENGRNRIENSILE